MQLRFSPAATRALRRMPQREAAAIVRKLETDAADPFGQPLWARRLQGEEGYRARQGDWRAVYKLDTANGLIIVERIADRREVYR